MILNTLLLAIMVLGQGTPQPDVRKPVAEVLKTIYLSNSTTAQELNDIVTTVRSKLQINRIVSNGAANAIVIRDTSDKIAAADKLIADLDKPRDGGAPTRTVMVSATTVAIDINGNPSVIEGGRARRIPTAGPQLQNAANPVSIKMNEDARVSFVRLAEIAGLNLILDRELPPGTRTPFTVENVGLIDALDLLSAQTGTFWQVLGSNTILVEMDTNKKRRDHDQVIYKTITLTNPTTLQGLNEIMSAVRTTLDLSAIVVEPTARAIVIRDNPNNIALAEKLIADLDRPTGSGPVAWAQAPAASVLWAGTVSNTNSISILDGGRIRNVTPNRVQLQIKSAGPISIRMDENVRESYETLAGMAGLNIIFERHIKPERAELFHVDRVDVLDALDYLSLQTGTFWIALDSKTIFVAPDTPTDRRDYERVNVKTIYLANPQTTQEVNNVLNAVRQVVNISMMTTDPTVNAIIIRDSPAKIVLAQKIIVDLDKPKGDGASARSAPIPVTTVIGTGTVSRGSDSIFVFDAGGVRNVTPRRSEIQPSITGPVSVRMNENARDSYETLAKMGGLNIRFDPRFTPGIPSPFHLEDVNILDALDYLSMGTGNFWEVVDSKTILVAPDNTSVHRELDTQITKTFTLTNRKTRQGANDILNALRQTLHIAQITINAENGIEVRETASNLVLVEKMIADWDLPPR